MDPDQPPPADDRDAALQGIIDSLAKTGHGQPAEVLIRELDERIRQHGLPAMPPTWSRAVATQAAVGNPYVISRTAATRRDVPNPDTPNQPFGIS